MLKMGPLKPSVFLCNYDQSFVAVLLGWIDKAFGDLHAFFFSLLVVAVFSPDLLKFYSVSGRLSCQHTHTISCAVIAA